MFARPAKQLPGKWQLFEYYIDRQKELEHITEESLKLKEQQWDIEFTEDEEYFHCSFVQYMMYSAVPNTQN